MENCGQGIVVDRESAVALQNFCLGSAALIEPFILLN